MAIHELGSFTASDGRELAMPSYWTSNEIWPSDLVHLVSAESFDSAFVVGSANASTIAPLVLDLKNLGFLDIEQGQGELFRYRVEAARRAIELVGLEEDRLKVIAESYIAALQDLLPNAVLVDGSIYGEISSFDFARFKDKEVRHYACSTLGLDNILRAVEEGLTASEQIVDITDPSKAASVALSGAKRIGWFHASNVAHTHSKDITDGNPDLNRTEVRMDVSARVIEFIKGVPGVDSDTLVTYSVFRGDRLPMSLDADCDSMPIPIVDAVRLGDLEPTTFFR